MRNDSIGSYSGLYITVIDFVFSFVIIADVFNFYFNYDLFFFHGIVFCLFLSRVLSFAFVFHNLSDYDLIIASVCVLFMFCKYCLRIST